MRFIVDSMLGKLAKRLRMLGYDTLYDASMDDRMILKTSKEECRYIVTRDEQLSKIRGAKVFLIISTKLDEQLSELKKSAKIRKDNKLLFSRCANCNTPLEKAKKEAVKDIVPKFVYDTVKEYRFCPVCKKAYWHGTHIDTLLKDLRNM
jgi:uncharacterized protein with PIN domain